jgi:hypothetical protein
VWIYYSIYPRNYDSTYRLKATEDSGDEETQSKNNQKVERSLLVSVKSYTYKIIKYEL